MPFKRLSNEWVNVRSKGHPRDCQPAQFNSLKKKLNISDEVLEVKLIKEPVLKDGVEFEMVSQQKSKWCVDKELKREVRVDHY